MLDFWHSKREKAMKRNRSTINCEGSAKPAPRVVHRGDTCLTASYPRLILVTLLGASWGCVDEGLDGTSVVMSQGVTSSDDIHTIAFDAGDSFPQIAPASGASASVDIHSAVVHESMYGVVRLSGEVGSHHTRGRATFVSATGQQLATPLDTREVHRAGYADEETLWWWTDDGLVVWEVGAAEIKSMPVMLGRVSHVYASTSGYWVIGAPSAYQFGDPAQVVRCETNGVCRAIPELAGVWFMLSLGDDRWFVAFDDEVASRAALGIMDSNRVIRPLGHFGAHLPFVPTPTAAPRTGLQHGLQTVEFPGENGPVTILVGTGQDGSLVCSRIQNGTIQCEVN